MEKYKKLLITFKFGETTDPLNKNNSNYVHRGIDFRPDRHKLVRCGFPGIVRKIDYDRRGGLYIQIKSIINNVTFYTNIFHNHFIFADENDIVRENEIIGIAGNTGEVTGEHIHLEICSYSRKDKFILNCKKKVPYANIEKEGRIFFDPVLLYDYFCEIGVKYEGLF
jgi:murein DD-endopeptidase MepM/ murein hydrolase activator NlpD